jgi:hypothetical protein
MEMNEHLSFLKPVMFAECKAGCPSHTFLCTYMLLRTQASMLLQGDNDNIVTIECEVFINITCLLFHDVPFSFGLKYRVHSVRNRKCFFEEEHCL